MRRMRRFERVADRLIGGGMEMDGGKGIRGIKRDKPNDQRRKGPNCAESTEC